MRFGSQFGLPVGKGQIPAELAERARFSPHRMLSPCRFVMLRHTKYDTYMMRHVWYGTCALVPESESSV